MVNKFHNLTIIGFIVGTLITVSFVPQALKIWKEKSSKEVSLLMYSIISTGIFLWFLYGLYISSLPIVFANGISFIFTIIVLAGKIKFG